jgi:hypothetical protein
MTRLLDTREAASRVSLARTTLAKLRVYGGGPRYIKLVGKILYPEDELQAWIDGQTLRSSTAVESEANRRSASRGFHTSKRRDRVD